MPQQVPFHITAGLPFGKAIEVTLPTVASGRDWWTAANQFEVLSQIRIADDPTSPLLLDLTQFIDFSFTNFPDTFTITLSLTGADTRLLTQSGYYDIVVSDILTTDARAYKILEGVVYYDSVLTADVEATA